MCPGPPLPLLSNFPLQQLLLLVDSVPRAGAWFRGASRVLRLLSRSSGRSSVLIAGDLGFLLRHCASVLVRVDAQAALLGSELLIQWRALRVVTGTPYLPCPHRLQELFPDSEMDAHGFHVPTRNCPPEAVLAECVTHGIPVAETHIIYRAPTRHSSR